MARKKSEFVYNRVLKQADMDTFGVGTRKGWEIHMALKTLRDSEATGPEALLLGVGAAKEATIFHLANGMDCRFVIPTDLYLDMGVWKDWAGPDFLKHPGLFKGEIACDIHRIIPRHADMTQLPFPNESVDGIFSSGSIEHVGQEGVADWDAIAAAASEIGRVLKPGGVASLSTEWKLSGEGWGWSHVRLFDAGKIMAHIYDASGLEFVDEPDWSFDGDLADAVELSDVVSGAVTEVQALRHNGFVFTSVHLALRKPA